MNKIFAVATIAISLFLLPHSAQAGAGGTTFSNFKIYNDAVTVDILSSIITTKKYNLSFSSNVLTPTSPGRYLLNLVVNSAVNTFPNNTTNEIGTNVRLLNPNVGGNFLSVQVVGPKDGSLGSNDVVYGLAEPYGFDFNTNSQVGDEDEVIDEQPDTTSGPDLVMSVPKIEAVKILLKEGGWAKRFKVTAQITNEGDEDASGPIVFNYRGPLPNKYNPDTDKTIPAYTPTVTKVVTRNGLKAGASVKSTFYVLKSYLDKMYVLTADPAYRIEETKEDNNAVVIRMDISL